MAKLPPPTCRFWVPQKDGSYKNLDDLSPEDREDFCDWVAEKLAAFWQDWFNQHPDKFVEIMSRIGRDPKPGEVLPRAGEITHTGWWDRQ